jgi:hypothetical protein
MRIEGCVKTKSYPAALFRKCLLIRGMRMAAIIIGMMITAGSLAWGQRQKEFIYLDGKVIVTESSDTPCTVGLYPGLVFVASASTNGTILVTAQSNCSWTVMSDSTWITLSGNSGTGTQSVNYSVGANPGGERRGSIIIKGNSIAVIQEASVPAPQLTTVELPGLGILLTWDFGSEYYPDDLIAIRKLPSETYQTTNDAYYLDYNYLPGGTYVYQVYSTAHGTAVNKIVTTMNFTDDPLTPGTIICVDHITQLRTAIEELRYAAGLPTTWTTDQSLSKGMTIKAAHINDLRDNLTEALQALNITLPTYTDDPIVARQTTIKSIHIQEIRNAIKQ